MTHSFMSQIKLSLRLTLRELRTGVRGFSVFLACLALGIWAMAAVGSLSRSLTEGLEREARVILGGDIALTLNQREAKTDELAHLSSLGELSKIATLRAMIRVGDDSALIELKAVDALYPSVGAVVVEPALPLVNAFEKQGVNNRYGALLDAVLIARLDLKIGDTFRLGTSEFDVRGVLKSEPDKVANGVGFGPRLMVSEAALRTTGLLQPGSLVKWNYRLKLASEQTNDAQLQKLIEGIKTRFPDAGWDVRSHYNVDTRLSKNIERFSQFLALVGLTALCVGGIGVANAVRAYLVRKRESIAIFKSLGATGRYVVGLHLTHILVLSLIGIAIGLVAGAATPFLIAHLIGASLPLPFIPVIAPLELFLSGFYGLLVAFAFSIWPLGRAHDVSVAQLFRDQIAPATPWPRRIYILTALSVWSILIVLSIITSIQPFLAMLYVVSVGVLFLAFYGLGHLVMACARALPRPKAPMLRFALGNLSRPAALTPVMILSIGLGMSVLAAIILIDSNVRSSLQQGIPANAPAFFMLDIPGQEGERFEEVVKTAAPQARFERVPMMRGRIMRINGIDVEKITVADKVSWVLDGDRGVTFASSPPQGSQIVQGEWWKPDYTGTPLVSFDQEIADGLGLKIGDELSVNVLGRTIDAKVGNLRKIEWRSYGINFVMIFSPNTFAGAPFTQLATVGFESTDPIKTEIEVLKAISKTFPTVTAIRVREAVQTVNDVVKQIAGAIRGASVLILLSGVLVLAGALAAVQRQRLYESVVLKTLGATRWRILKAHMIEYGVLITIAALIALVLGSILAYGLIVFIMKLTFTWQIADAIITLGAFGVVIMALSLIHSWQLLKAKPASQLKTG